MDKIYGLLLTWSITRLVNRQKTYQERCYKLNNIINALVDVYCDYSKGTVKHDY